ncbi:MAG: acyl-CoA dehydrogenase family protein, partial [Gammaproteobacteria bacterium]
NMQSTKEFLLSQVAGIRDTLAAQITEEESCACLSKVSSDALYDAGILKMKLPKSLGGYEADLVTQFEVLESLASINSAAAWCAMVGATSLGMPGAFLPEGGVKKMFANGVAPKGAIVIMPTGKAAPVDGGYQLSGTWSFASGVHHAQWISAHVMVTKKPGTEPSLHMFSFPAAEVKIHDNWHVLGLRGTGSCDISVENLFVPADCVWEVGVQAPQRGGALYKLGIPAFVAYEHAAFAVGVARKALDSFILTARTKKRGYGPDARGLGDRHTVQRFIGRSDLALRAARQLAIELNQRAMDTVESGDIISAELATEIRAVATYCTEVSESIVNEALHHSGAGSIYEKSDMQRYLRDINVAAQHLMVSDISYELLGRYHLGETDISPMA